MTDISVKSSFQAFPSFLKDNVLQLLRESAADPLQTASDSLFTFIKSFNGFLDQHHVPPISDINKHSQIGENFPILLRDFFDRLNSEPNAFNTGEEASLRADSFEENQHLGEFLAQVYHYLAAQKIPIISYGETFNAPACSLSENERPRIWKRTISSTGVSSFQEVRHIDFSKKAVICIGGLSCFHNNSRALNGFSKVAETMLGGPDIHKEGMEIYCVSHPTAYRALCESRTCFYNAAPADYTSSGAQMFVKEHVLPALGLEKENDHIPLAALKERLRKFNFFAFSYGTVFVKEIGNALAKELKSRGYANAEIKEAFAEVYSLNLGATCRFDVEKPHGDFSSVYVVSSNDLISRSRMYAQKWLQGKSPDQPAMIRIRDNELLVWTNSPRTGLLIEQLQAQDGSDAGNAKILSHVSQPTGHFPTLYAGRMGANDPRFMEYALRHAISGKRFADPLVGFMPTRLNTHPASYSEAHPQPGRFLMRALLNFIETTPNIPSH